MYVSAQTIITAGGVLTSLIAVVTIGWKLFKWINHQKEQDEEIVGIKTQHERDITDLKEQHEKDVAEIKAMHLRDQENIQEEQTLVVYGLLACLKGLAAQGCNGPVSEAIGKLEKHINKKAHNQE